MTRSDAAAIVAAKGPQSVAGFLNALDALLAMPPADGMDAMTSALARWCHDAMVAGHPWPVGLYSSLDIALTDAAKTIGGAA